MEMVKTALAEEFVELHEAVFENLVEETLPEPRESGDVTKPIGELVDWGLLTPIQEYEDLRELSVHTLVRDFCRDKQSGEPWLTRLRDAAAFYINLTKLTKPEEKSQAEVWTEIEAFELLMEAAEFVQAAALLILATELLNRWGYSRYLESQYRRLLGKLDRYGTAILLHNLGMLVKLRGAYGEALEHFERSLQIKGEVGDRVGVANSLHQIGMIHQDRRDYDKALEYYERSLQIKEKLGNRADVASSLHQIGMIHQDRRDYDKALEYYERSLQIVKDLDHRSGMAACYHQIGNNHFFNRDYEKALEYYERSVKILEELGDSLGIARSHGQIGKILSELGRYDEAFRNLLVTLTIFLKLELPDFLMAVMDLKTIRAEWGIENFDNAWKEATGTDVPDWLKKFFEE